MRTWGEHLRVLQRTRLRIALGEGVKAEVLLETLSSVLVAPLDPMAYAAEIIVGLGPLAANAFPASDCRSYVGQALLDESIEDLPFALREVNETVAATRVHKDLGAAHADQTSKCLTVVCFEDVRHGTSVCAVPDNGDATTLNDPDGEAVESKMRRGLATRMVRRVQERINITEDSIVLRNEVFRDAALQCAFSVPGVLPTQRPSTPTKTTMSTRQANT
jgi:hypothetical protein